MLELYLLIDVTFQVQILRGKYRTLTSFQSPQLTFHFRVGIKNSGKGQTLSKFGFDQFSKLKSYHIKYIS